MYAFVFTSRVVLDPPFYVIFEDDFERAWKVFANRLRVEVDTAKEVYPNPWMVCVKKGFAFEISGGEVVFQGEKCDKAIA